MISIGIDPGKEGGVAVINSLGEAVVIPYSDEGLIILLREASTHPKESIRVCLEKVNSMPGQGVVSMFNFGQSFGFIQGALKATGLPFQLVPPQTWKKEFSLIGKTKQDSVAVCLRLFPGVSLRKTDKCRTDSDGMAEALLMSEYARRRL